MEKHPLSSQEEKPPRLRFLLAAAFLTATVVGGALAVGNGWSVLTAMFRGAPAPAQQYVDNTPRSVSDENYTFTVESVARDEENAYVLVSVAALNEETLTRLMDVNFGYSMDFRAWVPGMEPRDGYVFDQLSPGTGTIAVRSVSQTQDSRSWYLDIQLTAETDLLQVLLERMAEDLSVEVPLPPPAPATTLQIKASGTDGINTLTGEPGTFSLSSVSLSPFRFTMTGSTASDTVPRIFFRMADGSVRTQSQMLFSLQKQVSSGVWTSRFKELQAPGNIVSLIVFDTEYPLDGSAPFPVDHDPALDPVTVPRGDPLAEQEEYLYQDLPIRLRPLMEALGGTFEAGPAEGQFTCTYRDRSVVFDPAAQELIREGQTLSTQALSYQGETPVSIPMQGIQNGEPVVSFTLIAGYWDLSGYVVRPKDGLSPNISDFGDWVIIP